MSANQQSSKRNTYAFLILVFVLTLAVHFLLPTEGGNLASFLIMWTPGLAAIFINLISKKTLKGLGWKFSLKWMAIGWLLPIVYGAVAYGTIWLAGLGDVPNPTFLERARLTMGMTSESDLLIITSAFFYITILSLIPNMVMALGEELGWRGFLVPEMNEWLGFKKTALFSGFIWAAWHLPGILSGSYGAAGTPLWYQLTCFSIMVISGAVILAWIRLKSGSVWPAVIFHATHNGVIQMFFERITLDTGPTRWFAGEFGIMLALISGIIAWYFFKRSTEVEAVQYV